MKTFTVETWLPIFSGFYGTIWETDSDEEMEIENINDARREKGLAPIEWDAVEWAYDDYTKDAVKEITGAIGDKLKREGFIESYKLQKLSSPREYNFANDSIHVAFTLNEENKKTIAKYLQENKSAFTKYIKDRYTSCDGFCSSYSNNVDVWLMGLDAVLAHKHQLGAVLNFILLNEDKDMETDICEDLRGNGLYLQAKNYAALTEVK